MCSIRQYLNTLWKPWHKCGLPVKCNQHGSAVHAQERFWADPPAPVCADWSPLTACGSSPTELSALQPNNVQSTKRSYDLKWYHISFWMFKLGLLNTLFWCDEIEKICCGIQTCPSSDTDAAADEHDAGLRDGLY